MTPRNALKNISDSIRRDSRLVGKLLSGDFSVCETASHIDHLLFVQLCALRVFAACRAAFKSAIFHVCGIVTKEEMIRSYASRVIALVTYHQITGITKVDQPRRTMSKYNSVGLSAKADPSVASLIHRAVPEPTLRRLVDLGPEAFSKRLQRSRLITTSVAAKSTVTLSKYVRHNRKRLPAVSTRNMKPILMLIKSPARNAAEAALCVAQWRKGVIALFADSCGRICTHADSPLRQVSVCHASG